MNFKVRLQGMYTQNDCDEIMFRPASDGVVHLDFDQIRPTPRLPMRGSNFTRVLEITRNERFRPSTLSGYPGISIVLRSLDKRVQQR